MAAEIGTLADIAEIPALDASKLGTFSFLKGSEDAVAPKDGEFTWDKAAAKVREHLNDAMNARHVAFLFGSGCSSQLKDGKQVGIPTMKPMAEAFLSARCLEDHPNFITEDERNVLKTTIGIDIASKDYAANLEKLMEVLYSLQHLLSNSTKSELEELRSITRTAINKVIQYLLSTCTVGAFSKDDQTVTNIYQSFYRKLLYRDRALPRPWIFTTNYDLFNETAMDRIGIAYCNGFSGTIERRFNPATFRYSLAEQLDISSRKWTAVDNFVYLCKLHGSVNWVEETHGLFPVRELQTTPSNAIDRVIIYPTPAKQNSSFASPYSDLFREFQKGVVRDQSVLFVVGYSFSDEHVNNIIFQALTIPTFRLVILTTPDAAGTVADLRKLGDPRIWMIGGDGPTAGQKAHYFDTFVEHFMPELPNDKVDNAVTRVLNLVHEKRNIGPTATDNVD